MELFYFKLYILLIESINVIINDYINPFLLLHESYLLIGISNYTL